MLQALPLVFILAGLTLYTLLGGADLGAGFWQLTAMRSRDDDLREYAHRAMGPVWEANHVWLIFVLTVFWTAYPKAFGSIASTLAVPLFLALIGILFRGVTYALRAGARTSHELTRIDTIFSLSSILVPFALGAAIGAIATDRVPVGNAAGAQWSSWLSVTSILIGILAVAVAAHLAAVYLAADAARDSNQELELRFRSRALGSGIVAGGLALATVFASDVDSHSLFHSLAEGRATALVVLSAIAGTTTLVLVARRRYELARCGAAVAVGAILVGWAVSRWPRILPGLTAHQAAAGHDTLVCLAVTLVGGCVILLPALALLFELTLRRRFQTAELPAGTTAIPLPSEPNRAMLIRVAAACLLAGVGLLNLADATWAHAFGVAALLSFVAVAFIALAVPPPTRPPGSNGRTA